MSAPPRLLIVVGPTAAGKSSLALRLAEHVGGEIVSADSQQVYRGMDLGTGKATAAERARVPHHLLDILDPSEVMTAQHFVTAADAAIAAIAARGRQVIVAGGTMLYIRALLLGLFGGPPADPALRARLAADAAAPGALWERLARVDPELAAKVNRNDLVRIIRALEVFELTGVPMSEHQRRHDHRTCHPRYPARLVGLAPEPAVLEARIEARVDAMLAAGLVGEVERLRAAGYGPALKSQQAIGYAELHRYLDGVHTLSEAVALVKRNSRRYARRQRSWYRGDERVQWWPEPAAVDLDSLAAYLH